ncbi:MAG: SH3 domain-containing protein [Polyangia bacterium]
MACLLAASGIGCGPRVADGDSGGAGVPSIPTTETGPSAPLTVGQDAVVVADFLNLRSAAGTSAKVLLAMPCGSTVAVVDGPSSNPDGWWNVQYIDSDGYAWSGWASGKYMALPEAYVFGTCGSNIASVDDGGTTPDLGVDAGGTMSTNDGGTTPPATPSAVDDILARAKLAVGYSYWWGHGAWRSDGINHGSCSGSCPSCTHGGSYGADCSGFIAKVWQVPSASALATDAHPYSTADFYDGSANWTHISRASVATGDAMVYRSGSEGHIALVESADDPYGAIWLYEARGCATGVVHDMRTLSSSYHAIRRDGL